jgi:hypothetical protein
VRPPGRDPARLAQFDANTTIGRASTSQPAPESAEGSTRATTKRSTEQVVQERAMGAVSDVLLNIEGTLAHAKKALEVIDRDGANANASPALADAIGTSSVCASGSPRTPTTPPTTG